MSKIKNSKSLMVAGLAALVIVICLAAVGCASTPTRLEQRLFNIQTNTIEQVVTTTNKVWQTNAVPVVTEVWRTNNVDVTQVNHVTVTNVVAVPVEVPVITTYTNHVTVYDYQPNTNAVQLGTIAKVAGAPFGVGDVAEIAVGGLLGLWGLFRSRRSNKTAAVLAQVIETGRNVLQSTPQGAQAQQAWLNWMIAHQAETGVIKEVMKLVDGTVNTSEAKVAADELLALMSGPSAQPPGASAQPPAKG